MDPRVEPEDDELGSLTKEKGSLFNPYLGCIVCQQIRSPIDSPSSSRPPPLALRHPRARPEDPRPLRWLGILSAIRAIRDSPALVGEMSRSNRESALLPQFLCSLQEFKCIASAACVVASDSFHRAAGLGVDPRVEPEDDELGSKFQNR